MSDLHVAYHAIYNILKHRTNEESALTVTEIYNEIGKELQVKRREIDRYLTNMSPEYGIVEIEKNPRRFYVCPEFSKTLELRFNNENLQIIYLALENLKQTGPKYIQRQCFKTETLIDSSIPNIFAKNLAKYRKKHHFNYGINGRDIAGDNKAYELVMDALRSDCSFTCIYESPNKGGYSSAERRHFAPLLYQLSGGISFLYVYDHKAKTSFNIRMTRIRDVEKSDEEIPEFAKEQLNGLDHSFGGYGLDFSKDELVNYEIICNMDVMTYFKEREIHSSQKIEEVEQWVYKVTFTLPPSREVFRLLKGFGAGIIEVSPPEISVQIYEKEIDHAVVFESAKQFEVYIKDNQDVKFDYLDNQGEHTTGRVVTPLKIVHLKYALGLRGYCHLRHEERSFYFHNMVNIQALSKK